MISRYKPIPSGIASHPYTVRSISDLPEELREQALKNLPPGEQVSCLFIVPRSSHPAQYHQPRFQPEQALIFTTHGLLSVQESDLQGDFPKPVFIKAKSLIFMQVSLILLYGRLEIIGVNDGESAKIIVEYNTVGHDLLQPAIHRFLAQSAERIENNKYDPSLEAKAWQDVGQLHMKYGNGLSLHAISKDEHLLHFVFQPAIREPILLGFTRRIAFPVLVGLTTHHLLILGEEQAKGHTDYGWIITYCPLSVIDRMEVIPEKNYQRLVIHLLFNAVHTKFEVKVEQSIAQKILNDWEIGAKS